MNHIERTYWERNTRRLKRRKKVHFDVTSTLNRQFLTSIRILTVSIILCVCFASSQAVLQDYDSASLTTSQGFTIFSGGTTVSDAGDINGDGFGDVAIGNPNHSADRGITFVIFGNGSGINSNRDLNAFVTGPTTGFRIFPVSVGTQFGISISSAGDVNGDGRDDLIIGAWGGDVGSLNDAGISYVIFGRNVTYAAHAFTDIQLPDAELDAAVGFRILGGFANLYSGYCVSGAGDVNHDRIDDVIIGGLNSGVVYVVFGKNMTGSATAFGDVFLSTITTTSTIGFRILAENFGQMFGSSVSHAGDVNGDGISDIIIGAHLAGVVAYSDTGISYVIFGHAVPLTAAWSEIQLLNAALADNVGFRILGAAEADFSGAHVSYAGDVNGDGVDDVIISAAEADPPAVGGDKTGAGITYIIFGRHVPGGAPAFEDIELSSVVSGSTIGFRILGANAYEYSGSAVSTAGDFNGDGVDDFIIGARYSDANFANSGVSYLIFGRKHIFGSASLGDIDLAAVLPGSTIGFRLFGSAAEEQSGYVVSNAGDVNGDGLDDIIVGSIYGPSMVIYGVSDHPTSQPSSQPSLQPTSQPTSQPTLQPTSAPSTQELSLSHLDNSHGFKMSLGSTVSTAGDLNGDGVDDMIVGASWINGNTGIAYVVFGNTENAFEDIDFAMQVTGQTTGFRILAAAAEDYFGCFVRSAGDVNGDGVDDIIIGAYGANSGTSIAGISYVIFGHKVTSAANAFTDIQLPITAMAAGVGFRILGAAYLDRSGFSVSGAGDVNGDGIDDVIVGAYTADPPSLTADSNGGIAYVVFGKNMTGSAVAFGDVDLLTFASSSTLGFRILGAAASDVLGRSVSRAGDVNNDGLSDIIVASRNADPEHLAANSNAGISYVIFGRYVTSPANAFTDIQLSSSSLPSNVGFRIIGAAENDLSGFSVSNAGDVNGDGIDDILISATGADPLTLIPNSNAGITYVIYGRDVAGGAPVFGDIFLSSVVTGSTIGFRILGAKASDISGFSVSNAGDVNGDSISDIIIGAVNADPQPSKADAGISYVIYGRRSLVGVNPFSDIDLAGLYLGSSVGFRILGAKANDLSGNAVSGAGDINGDGFDDVMIGTQRGPSYVIYGAPLSPTSQPSSQPSNQPSTQPSRQPSRQPTSQPTSAPSTQELSLSHLDNTHGFTMSVGSAVSSAGDLNGDGINDVVIGASLVNGNTGIAFVVFGSRNIAFENIDFNTRVTGQLTGFRILAAAAYDLLGQSVSKAGDVNGDGLDDVILGAIGADPTVGKLSAGISYVIFGRKVTSPVNAFADINLPMVPMARVVGFRILGAVAADYSGISVSGAGDVNGDGIDDVIVGAYRADPPSLAGDSNGGIAYVVFGKNMTGSTVAFGDVDLSLIVTDSTLGFRILGARVGDQLGFSVCRAGDMNNDGISDVVIGARYADPDTLVANSDAGISYVIFGRAPANTFGDIQLTSNALTSDVGFRIIGAAVSDSVGSAVSYGGDINADGIDDIVVGVGSGDPPTRMANSNAGITYVIYGRDVVGGAPAFGDILLSTLSAGSATGFRIFGAAYADSSGYRVSNAGDVNGDGVDDIIIGAINADPQPSKADAGISYVIYGRRSLVGVNPFSDIDLAVLYLGSSVGFRILGAKANDQSGNSVSSAGDINGDGFNDVMVGTFSGPSYVIYGAPVSPSSQPSSQPSRQPSQQPFLQPSRQPTTQPSRQPTTQPSRQPTVQPSRQPSRQPTSQPTSAPSTQELSLSHLNNARGFTMTSGGNSVSGAGDINGDGISDIIIGAYWANGNAGMTYVLFGRTNALIENIDLPTFVTGLTTGFRILPAASGGRTGWSVSEAGDVNGDGIDDVIMGARYANPTAGKGSAGISYVIFGRRVTSPANAFTDIQLPTTAMAASVGFRILGAAADDSSGYTVSGAGDINGDGIDDIIVGAYLADPPALPANSDAGAAYVIFGKDLTGSALAFGDVDLALLGTDSTVGFRILGAVIGDQCGFSVSNAGDINSDGVSDVIVGAGQADPPGFNSAGISYVIFGRKVTSPANAFEDIQLTDSALPSTVGFRILGGVVSGISGTSVSCAGDVNGDGMDDIIIGAPTARVSYVIFGRNVPGGATSFSDIQLTSSAMAANVGFRILGAAASDNSGVAVSAAGDVNSDGVDDVIVGARYGEPFAAKDSSGISYVVFGRKSINGAAVFGDVNLASIALGSLIGFRILGASAGDVSGYSVSEAGDVNGDGAADVLIGTQLRNSYVIYGTPGSPTSQPSSQPSMQPSASPTNPTSQPSSQPSRQPSWQPSSQPTRLPSSQPSCQPSRRPTMQPSTQPSRQPSSQPSLQPVSSPSSQPSSQPSKQPTCQPSAQPSLQPSFQPFSRPSSQPSRQPTVQPTSQPSDTPSRQPSQQPSGQPSSQPSRLPSCQPSSQPTVSPSVQPSTQPSVNPTAQPTMQPSAQPLSPPSAQPSCQPSTQPSSVPTLQPSLQPSAQPSAHPSFQPSVQPSTLPSSQPSLQPTVSPSAQPTSQPSAQPSAGPSMQPSRQPSNQPTSSPSTQPSRQPSCQPIDQPTAQPSQQPQGAPSGQPTTSPTSLPTIDIDTWVTAVDTLSSISELTTITINVWVCGRTDASLGSSCAVFGVPSGSVTTDYKFPWTDILGVLQTEDASRVVVSGHVINPANVVTSEVSNCMIAATHLTCVAKSFYDTTFAATAYVPFPKKLLYAGVYSTFATVSIEDVVTGAVKSYLYTSSTMQSVTISHIAAPPSFVGSFVAGTCVATNGAFNYIVSGMVRTDSGAMSAVYLAPVSGSILNTVDLVTAMTLEFVNPDSFIAGGLQLSLTPGKHAYLVRINALIGSIKYSKRYRVTSTGSATTEVRRRMLGETVTYNSVTRGMVLKDTELYMIVDVTRTDGATHLHAAILKLSMETGLILQQVHVSAANASLSCTDVAISMEHYLHLACSISRPDASIESIILATTMQLSLSTLPPELKKETSVIFQEENISFQRFSLPISSKTTQSIISDYELSTGEAVSTLHPSVSPTMQPSVAPSEQPSGQPSSSPTAAPSVSPQPTSHPSSSGPTNTYNPTVTPTNQPTAIPSKYPSQAPSWLPTTSPTARPTLLPTAHPSSGPSVSRTNAPTRTPTAQPSRKPSFAPSAVPTRAPSSAGTTMDPAGVSGGKGSNDSDLVMVIGGTVLGGVIALWLFSRLFRWYLHEVHSHAKKREIALQLYATRVLQAEQFAASQNPPERNRDKRRKVGSPKNRTSPAALSGAYAVGPLMSAHKIPEIIADNTNSSAEAHSVNRDEAAQTPSVHGSSSSDSSIVLSSLHSSERSDMNERYFSAVPSAQIAAVKPSKSRENVMEEGLASINTRSKDISESSHAESGSDSNVGSDFSEDVTVEEESSADEHSVSSEVSTIDSS